MNMAGAGRLDFHEQLLLIQQEIPEKKTMHSFARERGGGTHVFEPTVSIGRLNHPHGVYWSKATARAPHGRRHLHGTQLPPSLLVGSYPRLEGADGLRTWWLLVTTGNRRSCTNRAAIREQPGNETDSRHGQDYPDCCRRITKGPLFALKLDRSPRGLDSGSRIYQIRATEARCDSEQRASNLQLQE